MTNHDLPATVDTFFAALATGDIATCETAFTPDAVIWHNYDQIAQPKSQALAELAGLSVLHPRFEVIGRDSFPDGLVQRHVVHLTLPDGTAADVYAIQRIAGADGLIARIDEYMDTNQMAPVVAALQAGA